MITVARVLGILALALIIISCAPAAAVPVVNSADFLCLAAPFIFIALVMPRRFQTPAGDSASPSVTATPTPTAEAPAGPSL